MELVRGTFGLQEVQLDEPLQVALEAPAMDAGAERLEVRAHLRPGAGESAAIEFVIEKRGAKLTRPPPARR
ncbi:MAG: hypothetical protein RQ745_09935 [Longimicrobiales bacterium]|nr:hypothetical protein [Longimicrobiales bacterium]